MRVMLFGIWVCLSPPCQRPFCVRISDTMNARRAARELALLTLFQLDKQGKGDVAPAALEKANLRELALSSIRALAAEAEEKIQTAASDLADVSRSLLDYEIEH